MEDLTYILEEGAELRDDIKNNHKNSDDFITKKLIALTRNDYDADSEVMASKKMRQLVKNYKGVIAIHNHPNNSLPSEADIRAAANYKYGLIVCHDGSVIKYQVKSDISETEIWDSDYYIGLLTSNLVNYGYKKGDHERLIKGLKRRGVKLEWINLIKNN